MSEAVFSRPSWVFFDVGETLLRPYPSFAGAIVEVCAAEGVELDEEAAHRLADGQIGRFLDIVGRDKGATFSTSLEESRAFWLKFYAMFLTDLGLAEAEASALAPRLYAEFTRPERYQVFDDVAPVLAALSDAGIRMGVVSNFESWLDEMLDLLGIGGHFEVRAISGKEGVEKPDPEIFRRAVALAGAAPDEIIHVGDDPRADAEPAAGMGMGAVIIDRRGRHPGTSWPLIRSLEELPRLIGL